MQIITNNPKVPSACPGAQWVAGGSMEVLCECRKLVHEGYALLVHPLLGDIHLLANPFRSVILGDKKDEIDLCSVQWIEESIEKLQRVHVPKGLENLEDYQILDLELFQAANTGGAGK